MDEDTLSHSYVFFGQAHVGKYTFAKAFAYALETGASFDEALRHIEKLSLLSADRDDIFWYDTFFINDDAPGIDSIRELKRFFSLRPLQGKKRVVIINNAERITIPAQHALLKISEEAPLSSLIIFISRSLDGLLETVLSRSAMIYFKKPPAVETIEYLRTQHGYSLSEAEELCRYAYGLPGIAIQWKKDPVAFEKVQAVERMLHEVSLGELYRYADLLARSAVSRDDFFRVLYSGLDVRERFARQVMKEALRRQRYIDSTNAHVRVQLETVMNAQYAYRHMAK